MGGNEADHQQVVEQHQHHPGSPWVIRGHRGSPGDGGAHGHARVMTSQSAALLPPVPSGHSDTSPFVRARLLLHHSPLPALQPSHYHYLFLRLRLRHCLRHCHCLFTAVTAASSAAADADAATRDPQIAAGHRCQKYLRRNAATPSRRYRRARRHRRAGVFRNQSVRPRQRPGRQGAGPGAIPENSFGEGTAVGRRNYRPKRAACHFRRAAFYLLGAAFYLLRVA